jgi:hypothetical protein
MYIYVYIPKPVNAFMIMKLVKKAPIFGNDLPKYDERYILMMTLNHRDNDDKNVMFIYICIHSYTCIYAFIHS